MKKIAQSSIHNVEKDYVLSEMIKNCSVSDARVIPIWCSSSDEVTLILGPNGFLMPLHTQNVRSIYIGLNSSWFYCIIKDVLWKLKWDSVWTKSKTIPKTKSNSTQYLAIYLVGVCVTQYVNFFFYPGSVLLILKQSGNIYGGQW